MRFDAVIFDIDNVLIDTRASYTDCIRKTVETYLQAVFNFQPSRTPLLTSRDVEWFKSLGGFNDDWDTCYGLLLYLLSRNPKRLTLNELRKKKDLTRRAKSFPSKPVGTKGLERLFGKHKAVSLKKIADIFQRFYLGEFVWNEKLLIPKSFLKKLKRAHLKLGIVTGRSSEEARFALRRFQIDALIDALVTQDETPKNRKKPSPYGLFRIARILGRKLRYLYVGDLPDDILAARRARKKIKVTACGYLQAADAPSEMRRQLKRAGAHFICATPRELADMIHGK